jgi:hypothetical protein
VIGLWLRTELRRRWKAIIVLGVLAGLTGGLAMAAIDGARRSGTVLDRVSAATKQPDVAVLPSQFGFNWKPIEKLPEVKALGLFGVTYVLGATDQRYQGLSGFPPVGRSIFRDVDLQRVDQGRLPDPDNPHEAWVSAAAVKFLHVHIGQKFQIAGPTMKQWKAVYDGQQPTGKEPTTWVRIVGVSAHDDLWDRYIGGSGRADDPSNVGMNFSPALVERYPFGYVANALVILRHGGADLPRFRRDVARVTHQPNILIRDLSQDRARFGHSLTIEQTALLLFALAVTAAGVVLLGQALARLVQASGGDAVTLSSLGATRPQAVLTVAMPSLGVALVAAVTAVAVAIGLSPRFPIGLARSIELNLGVHVDWLVLIIGTLALAGAVVIGGALGAWFTVVPRPQPSRRTLVGRAAAALHLPIPVEFGARMALNRGRGRNAVPVRPALIAAVAGVLGIVGAFTFRTGLDNAVGNVALAGTTWQRVALVTGIGGPSVDKPVPDLEHVPGLRAAAEVYRTVADVGGESVSMWSYHPLVGTVRRVVTSGRLPTGPDETMMGVATAARVHAHVGSTIQVDGKALKVTGLGFLPEEEGHSAYDQGLWLTTDGFNRARTHEVSSHEVLADFRGVTVHVPPTVADLSGGGAPTRELAKALGHTAEEVDPAVIPAAMSNLGSVRGLPLALGVFLVVLAIGALAHALVSSVARRRQELAVLRALGVTSRASRTMIAVHATVVGLVGVVVGVPLGLIVGRGAWEWVASAVPFLYVAPLALVAAAVAIPAALILANLVAAVPARVASRVRPAEILRAE